MAKSTHPLLLRLAPWLLPVGTVIVWQLASSVGWLSTRVLPSPEGVLKAFWTLSASGELWQHLAISSWRALVGFAIGGSIGLILGLISGLSRWGERLLLLDEPLGALDALTRLEMQELIVSLWQEHGFTVLLVTHDVSEAVAMADRVLLIEEKKIGLDLSVDIPRPRRTGSAKLAELEAEVLDRVMKRGDSERAPRLFSHG